MRILNNQKFANLAQNTMAAVAVETSLKALGRPTFIALDKNTKPETKKYSASKEFLYQALCLGIYLTVIPLFKKGGYSIAKKVFSEDSAVSRLTQKLQNPVRNAKGKMVKGYDRFMYEYSLEKENGHLSPEIKKIKGGIEASSIVGSVLGLAVLAPQISHIVLHPIMNLLGLSKK